MSRLRGENPHFLMSGTVPHLVRFGGSCFFLAFWFEHCNTSLNTLALAAPAETIRWRTIPNSYNLVCAVLPAGATVSRTAPTGTSISCTEEQAEWLHPVAARGIRVVALTTVTDNLRQALLNAIAPVPAHSQQRIWRHARALLTCSGTGIPGWRSLPGREMPVFHNTPACWWSRNRR